MPREGTELAENASFVAVDLLVQLDDQSFKNIEMQKIGFNFSLPGQIAISSIACASMYP